MTRPPAGLRRSDLARLTEPDAFVWATGIEDTFITDPWPRTGRTLDEYELTGHYRRWRHDIDLMGELGVTMARYGVPWHRVNPAAGRWRWEWADRPLERLLEIGIHPIVDLVHYGTPQWIEGGFLHPDFPHRMAEYAARLADRFRGRIRWYTPLNEPRIAAWYCGKIGWWPPYRRGWRGFVDVMLRICRAIVMTDGALRTVDPEIVVVHVDATDLYASDDPALAHVAAERQAIVFLALDLVTGAVGARHRLRRWLARHGAADADVEWFGERGVELDVVGINMYPMFSVKQVLPSAGGVRIRMLYAPPRMVSDLVAMYWRRYRCPVMIAETASLGSLRRRRAWLEGSVEVVRTLRARGIPTVGYTWWPLFALIAWAYRQGGNSLERYLLQMGLWDLDPRTQLRRVRTPLVDDYRAIIADGVRRVGPVSRRPRRARRAAAAQARVPG